MGQRPKHKTMHFEKKMLHLGFGDEFQITASTAQSIKKKKKTLTNQTLSKFKTFVLYLKKTVKRMNRQDRLGEKQQSMHRIKDLYSFTELLKLSTPNF